jgi:hypothetical protein
MIAQTRFSKIKVTRVNRVENEEENEEDAFHLACPVYLQRALQVL